MDVSGGGKSPNAALSFRYNANNEELEELNVLDTDISITSSEVLPNIQNASPKKGDKTPSILDKYFKSMRPEKSNESPVETKIEEKPSKDVTASPMKEYLNRFNKKSTQEVKVDGSPDSKEGLNETWKLFQGFKTKITQAVEDMKSKSQEEAREKSVPRDNSMSDSEENSAIKDSDQQSVGDTDNQVSSLDSSMQNLSDITQPPTAKATEREQSLPYDNKNSDSSDDTHKNMVNSGSADLIGDLLTDHLEVESGVEALEDNLDSATDKDDLNLADTQNTANENPHTPQHTLLTSTTGFPSTRNSLKQPPNVISNAETKTYFLSYTMYILSFLLLASYTIFHECYLWNGFLIGLWSYCLMSSTKEWVLDRFFSDEPYRKIAQTKKVNGLQSAYVIPTVKEHTPLKKYECWVNHYRYQDYDPCTYHISNTTTAFLKLEGCNLRISYTRTKIAKRALWDEKIENILFYQHRLYNLTGAKVMLLPKGLAKRRQWSKKYPICLVLSEREKIQVLEKEPMAETRLSTAESSPDKKNKEQSTDVMDVNTSPEKRKKFVWRRRDKSASRSDVEPGREGLRHRIARKMHREKKSDASPVDPPESDALGDKTPDEVFHEAEADVVSTASNVAREDDEDLDENELAKIKDFLEEAEPDSPEATTETEWSVRTKHSKDMKIYLFARTGRDKQELYRRLMVAISDARPSEPSTAEDKSASDGSESKDLNHSFKLTEKDTVTFTVKSKSDSLSEGVTISTAQVSAETESLEKAFWPYIMKIIQSRPANPCSCKVLPAEMSWVNAVIARFMFDAMRNQQLRDKLQNRIQRKLNTMKLPSFMSPLMVTSLSLSGACPQLEWIASPSCDERGVWLDADLKYEGGAYISILTQINLMKLKQKNVTLEDQLLNVASTSDENIEVESSHPIASAIHECDSNVRLMKPAIFDSEEEDSAESSSDEEAGAEHADDRDNYDPPNRESTNVEGTSSKKRFLRIVDRIATNKYFQTVTDYKYVKKAMEGLSHTDIKLHLELHGLEGRLAINLPPPPHDRIWLGFRTNPALVLKARPAVGARTLRFGHISNWIESKLSKEFEKVLVLPNMEDFVVDLMAPTPAEHD